MAQLLSFDIVTPAERTDWVSDPLNAPKEPLEMYRLTVDYRLIIAAAIKNTWPMPLIDVVILNVRGAQAFATIDFTSGYWQLSMHHDSQLRTHS